MTTKQRAKRRQQPDHPLPVIRDGYTRGVHRTSIEWADFAVNPIRARDPVSGKTGWACTKVSDGCTNCYAESLNRRFGTGLAFSAQNERLVEWVLDRGVIRHMLRFRPRGPFRRPGSRPIVFIGDMTDLFHERVPAKWLLTLWAAFAFRPDIDWVILTKRPERMVKFLAPESLNVVTLGTAAREVLGRRYILDANTESVVDEFERHGGVLPNVWLGTSVESAKHLDRLDHLSRCDAGVRVVSFEPLLADVADALPPYLAQLLSTDTARAWIIAGGESGASARGTNLSNILSLAKACDDPRASVFIKQIGSRPYCADGWLDGRWATAADGERLRVARKGAEMESWPMELRRREWPR